MGSNESRRAKSRKTVATKLKSEAAPTQDDEESDIRGTVLERGRQLFDAVLPDNEMMIRIRRWFTSQDFGITFDELPLGLLATLLKWTLEGVKPKFDRFIQSDGTQSISFIVPLEHRHGKTDFDGEELEALEAYLRLRIERIGIEPPVRPWTPLRRMIHLIEETNLSKCAIQSDEFKDSKLYCIRPDVILNLAEQAGLTLLDAKRLSFMELVRGVAQRKLGGKQRRTTSGQSVRKPRMGPDAVDEHCELIMRSGDNDKIHRYLAAGERRVAKEIGCSRESFRGSNFYRNRSDRLRVWMKDNAKTPTRKRIAE